MRRKCAATFESLSWQTIARSHSAERPSTGRVYRLRDFIYGSTSEYNYYGKHCNSIINACHLEIERDSRGGMGALFILSVDHGVQEKSQLCLRTPESS
jgi:hypothetical protein